MRAMILAAGRGERMRALTASVPKPLLRIGRYYLIEYSLYALAKHGIQDVVINICYRGEQIQNALGDGARYGLTLHYSEEKEALGTGGGIYQALPLLGTAPFIVMSADIMTDYPLQRLPTECSGLAHLVLVDNPTFHPQGDFCLHENKVYCGQDPTFTFGNIGLYRPELFANCRPGYFDLGKLLKEAATRGEVTGEQYRGVWHNIGTPEEIERCSLTLMNQ